MQSWGGLWMWESIDLKRTFHSVITAIKNNTAIWATDGSFDRAQAPSISSARWIIYCPSTKHYLHGSFYEVLPDSRLSLMALHLVVLAIKIHFKTEGAMGSIHCNNDRALGRANLFCCRIHSGSKHGDLLCLLRNINHTLGTAF